MKRSIFNTCLLFLISFSYIYSYNTTAHSTHTKFPPYSTEQYIYTKTTAINSNDDTIITEPIIISDITSTSYFTTAITRVVITQQSLNNQHIIITETWVTKKPSYCTSSNIALAAIISIITGTIALLHNDDFIMSASNHWLTYLLTHEKYKIKTIASLSDKIINKGLISENDLLKAVGEMGLQQFKKILH